MTKCAAITGSGRPCKGLVRVGSEYCPAHDPDRAEARKKSASKAGRAKPSSELSAVKHRLKEVADEVLEGEIERGNASVAAQVLGVYLRAVEAERKIKETEELAERLEALEAQASRGGTRWGA